MHYRLVYTTFACKEDAERVADILLDKHLIACANIFPGICSMYRWQGKKHKEQEIAMIIKTRQENFSAIEEAIVSEHPYETPCVLCLNVSEGHKGFLDWIDQSIQN